MKAELQRIAIAEACGWKCAACLGTGTKLKMGPEEYHTVRNSNEKWRKEWPLDEPDIACQHEGLPDYLNDLNACQDAWTCLGWEEKNECVEHLKQIVKEAECEVYFATAAQRCEAFLRTLCLWKDEAEGEVRG